jgi:hypothetical protein
MNSSPVSESSTLNSGSRVVLGCLALFAAMFAASGAVPESLDALLTGVSILTTAVCGGGAVAAIRSGDRRNQYVGALGALWVLIVLVVAIISLR